MPRRLFFTAAPTTIATRTIRREFDPRRARLNYSAPINRSLLWCARWADGAGELYGRQPYDYQAASSNDAIIGSPQLYDGLFGYAGTTSSYVYPMPGGLNADRLGLGVRQTLGFVAVLHSQWAMPGQPNSHSTAGIAGNNGGTDTGIMSTPDAADSYHPIVHAYANTSYVTQADAQVKIPPTMRNRGRPIVVVFNWTAAASGSGWDAYIDGVPVSLIAQSNSVSAVAEVDGYPYMNGVIGSYASISPISYTMMRLEPFTLSEIAALTADPLLPFRASRFYPIAAPATTTPSGSLLTRKVTRTRQPQVAPTIDWSNPITKDLLVAATPNSLSSIGSISYGKEYVGIRAGRLAAPVFATVENSTILAIDIFTGIDQNGMWWAGFESIYSDNGTSWPNYSGLGMDSPSLYGHVSLSAINSGGSGVRASVASVIGNQSFGGSIVRVATVAPDFLVRGWGNGVYYGSSTEFQGVSFRSIDPATATAGRVGIADDLYSNPNDRVTYTALVLRWQRVLSDTEIASISANPWQVFKPIRIRSFAPATTAPATTTPLPRIRRVKRTGQPQVAPDINWGNPLVRGLTALVNGGPGLKGDLVSNQQAWEVFGNPLPTADGFSIGNYTTGNNGVYWDRISNPATKGPDSLWPSSSVMSFAAVITPFVYDYDRPIFGTTSGSDGWYIASRFSDGRLQVILNDGSMRLIQSASGDLVLNKLNVVVASCDGATLRLYSGGRLLGSTAVGGGAIFYDASFAQHALGGAQNPFLSNGVAAATHFGAVWNRALSDVEIKELNSNPWQLFKPIARYYTSPVSVASATKPNSDVLTSGWYTTEATYYGAINEVVYNDTTYISSPNIVGTNTYTITMGLDNTLSSGSYEVSVRMKSNASTKLRVSLLDSSNTILGISSWQNTTNSYALYTLPVSITGTATRVNIEVANI